MNLKEGFAFSKTVEEINFSTKYFCLSKWSLTISIIGSKGLSCQSL
jgi:hypothetical protein